MASELKDILRSVYLFEGVPPEALDGIIESGRVIDCDPGEVLINEGEPHSKVFVVIDGFIEVMLRDPTDGTRPLRLARCGPGSVLGEMSLVDPQVCQSIVRTTRASRVFLIRYKTLNEIMEKDPALAAVMLRNKLRTITRRLREEAAEFLHYRTAAA